MPDFSIKINSRSDYKRLVESENDKDINKVILFTKKEKLSPAFLATVAHLRDRLRFYIIPILEKNPSKDNLELQQEFNAEELPKLFVMESYDALNDQPKDEEKVVLYDKEGYKYKDLVGFLDYYAISAKKEESDDMFEQKMEETAAPRKPKKEQEAAD